MRFNNIEAERARLNMTREIFAKQLGVTSKTLRSWVNGEAPIPSNKLIQMCNMFNCSTDYLLGRCEEKSVREVN